MKATAEGEAEGGRGPSQGQGRAVSGLGTRRGVSQNLTTWAQLRPGGKVGTSPARSDIQWEVPGWGSGALTTLGLGEAVVQAEDHLLHEVLDVTLLRAADEHHPVVREALRGGLLAQLGPVPQL